VVASRLAELHVDLLSKFLLRLGLIGFLSFCLGPLLNQHELWFSYHEDWPMSLKGRVWLRASIRHIHPGVDPYSSFTPPCSPSKEIRVDTARTRLPRMAGVVRTGWRSVHR
jgi:hypothetical protein